MLKTTSKIVLTALIALGLVLPAFTPKAEAKGKRHKVGFSTRVVRHAKRDIKRNVKKARRAVVKTGHSITNAVADTAAKAKVAVSGKKAKSTWVKGHYKKGNKHSTKGHWARINRSKKPAGGAPAPAPAPSAPAPAPSAPALSDPAMPQ